jgi:hypothetical protein
MLGFVCESKVKDDLIFGYLDVKRANKGGLD